MSATSLATRNTGTPWGSVIACATPSLATCLRLELVPESPDRLVDHRKLPIDASRSVRPADPHPTPVRAEAVPAPPRDHGSAHPTGPPLRTRRSGCAVRWRTGCPLCLPVGFLLILRPFRLMGGHGRDSRGHRVRLAWRPGCLTRRGVMSRRAAAHLSRRRSALRRCPSGEAQYCAGVSHPATPPPGSR